MENTRRLLQVNVEETVTANARRDAALARLTEAEQNGVRLAEERDEALRKCKQTSVDAIVDIWNTHSVQVNLVGNPLYSCFYSIRIFSHSTNQI